MLVEVRTGKILVAMTGSPNKKVSNPQLLGINLTNTAIGDDILERLDHQHLGIAILVVDLAPVHRDGP